jgi:hypothetical protein
MPRLISVTYCDDIRNEIEGKLSFIGVYGAVAHLSAYPALLPKFAINIAITVTVDEVPETTTSTVSIDDREIGKITLTRAEIEQNAANNPMIPPPGVKSMPIVMNQNIIISPLQLEHSCKLSIHVTIDGEAFAAPSLWFT